MYLMLSSGIESICLEYDHARFEKAYGFTRVTYFFSAEISLLGRIAMLFLLNYHQSIIFPGLS